MYYIQLLIAFIVGQLLFISICAYYIQKNKPEIDYWKSLQIFFRKELGGFVVAATFWLALLFVLPDFINLNMTRTELLQKENLTKVEKAQVWFRTIATLIGLFAQLIPFVLFKRGQKAIEDYVQKNNLQ